MDRGDGFDSLDGASSACPSDASGPCGPSSTESPRAWRVAWLTESYPPSRGGMAQSCDRIVRGLRAAGVEVDLLHCSNRLSRWEERRQVGGHYLACPVQGDPAHALNRLWSRIEHRSADYTHLVAFGGVLPLLAAPVYAAWMGCPLISLLRGNDLDTALFQPARAAALTRALEGSTLVGCVACDQMRKIGELYPQVETRWVPNGIDPNDWRLYPFDRERACLWRELAVPQGRLVLGLFGHLKSKKGLDLLLDALRASPAAGRLHLLLVGELGAETAERIERDCATLSLTVLPFLDRYDLLPFYALCDYVALPSFYDGMPNVLLESLALGIPLVASRVGGMADLLEDGAHGFLHEPADLAGLRNALARAAGASVSERRRMSDACRSLALERASAKRETAAYLELLGSASDLRRSGSPASAQFRTDSF